jgi:hypothetical protein
VSTVEADLLARATRAFRVTAAAERLVAAQDEADLADREWDALRIVESGVRCQNAAKQVRLAAAELRKAVNG